MSTIFMLKGFPIPHGSLCSRLLTSPVLPEAASPVQAMHACRGCFAGRQARLPREMSPLLPCLDFHGQSWGTPQDVVSNFDVSNVGRCLDPSLGPNIGWLKDIPCSGVKGSAPFSLTVSWISECYQ